jgi:hypothetical protein
MWSLSQYILEIINKLSLVVLSRNSKMQLSIYYFAQTEHQCGDPDISTNVD